MLSKDEIKLIKHKMVDLDLTQSDLSRELEITKQSISLVLKGVNLPLVEQKVKSWYNNANKI